MRQSYTQVGVRAAFGGFSMLLKRMRPISAAALLHCCCTYFIPVVTTRLQQLL
jgi:hypothetical protein